MSRTRHVWVRTDEGVWPGLVLDWRRGPSDTDWEAFTCYVGVDDVVVSQWLPAAQLEPIPGAPYSGTQYG